LLWARRNFFPILYAIAGKSTKEDRENVKIALEKQIKRLDVWENLGPSEAVLAYYLKNIDKIIQLIKNFKEKENESVYAYLCVIDEIYPNLGQMLEKEIEKYNSSNRI
jgi:undecaprenyl pyrophosphate phosphatase UppP